MLEKPVVTVLMSTYNGEKYLEKQIDSVLSQKGVNVNILVRDDLSTDGTINILKSYEKQNKLHWYTGENLGPAYSFMDLIFQESNSDYYAFCDQDDIWLESKLSRAIDYLREKKNPTAYFSSKTLVNNDLEELPYEDSVVDSNYLSLDTMLFKSLGSGCTIVFNKELKTIVNLYTPDYITMHDSWVLTLAIIFGEVVYDSQSSIFYRIHDSNSVGVPSTKELWKQRIKNVKEDITLHARSRVANEIYKGYGTLISNKESLELIKNVANINYSFKSRFFLLTSGFSYSPKKMENLFINLKIILGWI